MTSTTPFVSRYDQRVKLLQDVLKEDTKLTDDKSHKLAVRLLHTLDTIPEKLPGL
jgi:hypothetical protein